MSGPSRSSGSSHRGWRGASDGKRQPSKSAKRTARMIMLLVVLGLVGLFAWMVLPPFFNPDVHLVHLPVVNYNALALPAIPYSSEDEAAFASASPYGGEESLVLRDSQTSEGMAPNRSPSHNPAYYHGMRLCQVISQKRLTTQAITLLPDIARGRTLQRSVSTARLGGFSCH